MNIVRMARVLIGIKLLTPIGLFRFAAAVWKYGLNIMALLGFAASTHSKRIALVDEQETLNYSELLSQSDKLAFLLYEQCGIRIGQRVGFMCRNHAVFVKSMFAASRLGADIYLLNAEMSASQLEHIIEQHDFHFIVYDREASALIEHSSYSKGKMLSYDDRLPSINGMLDITVVEKRKLRRTSMGRLVVLTGGTTGRSKAAAHKPSVFNYLNPFIALITRLQLMRYQTAYIATPIYHGYGVAVCLLFIAVGKKMVIRKRFDAENACELIREHQVEIVTVVPLMLHKMLKHDAVSLRSLACIASGSAELNPKLVEETRSKLGDIVYNLYGTSEAGLNVIATPQDLRAAPTTIGKQIEGVRLKIVDEHQNEVGIGQIGQICIHNKWSRKNGAEASWIETGDIGYRDDSGLLYLCGRVDDMVISAGVNVYPIELEQALIRHPQVEDIAVIGVPDEHFGQRLRAYVQLAREAQLSQEELLEWLRPKIARYQMPREIMIVDQLPYTPVGKLDKKQLKGNFYG